MKIVARLGHLFLPLCVTGKGTTVFTKVKPIAGPVVVPGKVFDWSLLYDPQGDHGNGSIRLTLGDETATLDLEPGRKAEGATFDRFGLLTGDSGGQLMTIYFDDLKYTAGKP